MSANVGIALMLVSRPATFTDKTVSRRVRDAVHAVVFTPEVMTPSASPEAEQEVRVPATAARLSALLSQSTPPGLTPAETTLLTEWLNRLSNE